MALSTSGSGSSSSELLSSEEPESSLEPSLDSLLEPSEPKPIILIFSRFKGGEGSKSSITVSSE